MAQKPEAPYSLRLSREDQAKLQEQAKQQGLKPHALALKAVRAYLKSGNAS